MSLISKKTIFNLLKKKKTDQVKISRISTFDEKKDSSFRILFDIDGDYIKEIFKSNEKMLF